MRKGMMVGSGKRGYHNIIGKDPKVHSDSARGRKQPQKIRTFAQLTKSGAIYWADGRNRIDPRFLTQKERDILYRGTFKNVGVMYASKLKGLPTGTKYMKDSDGDGVPDSKDCQPFNPNRQDDTSAFKKASKDAKAQFAEGRSFGQIRESLITNPELDEGDIDMILSKVDTKAEKSPGTFDVGEITQPNKGVNDVGKIGASSKVEAFAKRAAEAGKKGFVFAKKEVAKYQKKQQEKKVKLLEKVKNPLAEKLIAQKKRVQELEKQISESQDSQQENKLFSELKEEENQLRELQEKVTDMKLQDFSDAELKTLAVRYQPDEGLLSGFFSTPSNPYEKELLRRIEKKEMLEKEITDTRKKAKSQESSGGGGFFGF